MSLSSLFSKKPPEPTSVADVLAGTSSRSSGKSKSRKSDANSAEAEQLIPERKRARRRLIGAIVIVLAVVIGVPMVLDSEPQTVNKNIVIQIPSRDEDVKAPLADKEDEVSQVETAEPDKDANKETAAVVAETPTPTPTPKPAEAKKTPTTEESSRALAILEGKDPAKTTRIVVQVGAFATQEKVKQLQSKLSSAGIKSYTQKVATSSGEKIRVRIGPFTDRESADKAKLQLEKLGLNGTLVSL